MAQSAGEGRAPGIGPEWARDATPLRAFVRGVREVPPIPSVMLLSAVMGFGALAGELGLSLGQAVFVTGSVFALPGQVALVDQVRHGASVWAAFFAVALTAVRLTPMAVVIAPYLRGSRLPWPLWVLAAHFIAVTLWVEGLRRLPLLPEAVRLPYFLGSGVTLGLLSMVATLAGYVGASQSPPWVAAALFFLTPIYFVISLLRSAWGSRQDELAIGLGLLLGPLLFVLAPEVDLLLTGLVGGTLAWLAGRRLQPRPGR